MERKIPDASTLTQTNQYNTDNKNLEKKTGEFEIKIPDIIGLVTTAVINTKIGEAGNKIPDASGLVTTAILNVKFGEVKIKFLMLVT